MIREFSFLLVFLFIFSFAHAQDTLKVRGEGAIFFTPNKVELSMMPDSVKNKVMDFYQRAGGAKELLDSQNISVYVSSASVFKLTCNGKEHYYRRSRFDDVVGVVIVYNKKKPEYYTGLWSDEDYEKLMKEYFEIH